MVFQNGIVELPVFLLVALVVIGGLLTWLVCRLRHSSKLAAALADFEETQTGLQETINRQVGELEQLTTRFIQAEKALESKNQELLALTGLKSAA